MANKANASIQQYEPLRTPGSWDDQGKQFAVRLQDILDDIYKRFGRIGIKDLGAELREDVAHTIIVAEDYESPDGRVGQVESQITQLPDTVMAMINENGVTTTAVTLDKNGVAVASRGNFTVAAGGYVGVAAGNTNASFINLGDTFSANAVTGVSAKQAMFGTLYVGGREIKPSDNIDIKVASSQPYGSNMLWVKPVASGGETKEVSYSARVSARGTAEMLSSGSTRSHAISGTERQDSGAQTYRYTLSFFVTNIGSTPVSATIGVSLSNGSTTVSLGSVSTGTLTQWSVKQITLSANSPYNVCTGSTVYVYTTATSGGNSNLFIERDQDILMSCRSTFAGVSSGVMPCELYWLP